MKISVFGLVTPGSRAFSRLLTSKIIEGPVEQEANYAFFTNDSAALTDFEKEMNDEYGAEIVVNKEEYGSLFSDMDGKMLLGIANQLIPNFNKLDITRIGLKGYNTINKLKNWTLDKPITSIADLLTGIAEIKQTVTGKSNVIVKAPLLDGYVSTKPSEGTENIDYITYDSAITLLNSESGKDTDTYVLQEQATKNLYLAFWKSSLLKTGLQGASNANVAAPFLSVFKYGTTDYAWDNFTKGLPTGIKIFDVSIDGGMYLIRIDHNDTPDEKMVYSNVTPKVIMDDKFGTVGDVDRFTRKLSDTIIPGASLISDAFNQIIGDKSNIVYSGNLGEQISSISDLTHMPSHIILISLEDIYHELAVVFKAAQLGYQGPLSEGIKFLNKLILTNFNARPKMNKDKAFNTLVLFSS